MFREHTVEEYFKFRSLSGIEFSGDGKYVTLVSSKTYREKKMPIESSILVYEASTKSLFREIYQKESRLTEPKLSSDGRKLAYLQKTGDNTFLVLSSLEDESQEKLLLDGDPHGISWAGESILLNMTEPQDRAEKDRRDSGFDGTFFEEDERFWSLYLHKPGAGFRKITSGIQVWDFSVCGNMVAFIGSDTPLESSWYQSRVYTMDISGKGLVAVYDPEWRTVARPRISPDSSKVALLESLWSDRGVTAGDIIICDIHGGKYENITENTTRSYSDIIWNGNSGISALWTEEGSFGISTYNGKWKDLWNHKCTVSPAQAPEFSLANGKYALVMTDENAPQEAYLMDESGNLEKISSTNNDIGGLKRYPAEVVKWESDDGLEIYGILRSIGKNMPLIVYVHGGPTSFSSINYIDRATLLLGSGFSVFMPNYRGSIGKGRKFAEANRGDMGGKDFRDIMTGIEYLRKSGKIETDNIFITGGSYGGFMTSWAVTQTSEFKAAVGLFGISDWVSFHGTTNIPAWDAIHYNDDPYRGKLFEKFSPLNYISNITTPVLLMHGVDDPCVPVGQYYQFYRAMKECGKEVRLLLFPREGHGFTEKKHIEQYTDETVKWFKKYMS
ncbi:MAG: S9 family peptidase [Thermoplasmatales archaeon]|nr:S9 family peptidase [Thermoplasmatales archaeon]